MLRYLPIIAIVVVVVAVLSYLPVRRELAYKLGLAGDNTESCCNVDNILAGNGEFDESATSAIFEGETVDYPKTSLAQANIHPILDGQVLGTTNSNGEEKWIEVSLSTQMLRAWEGSNIVMEFPISSGKWYPTPKGTYYIWYKTRNQRMSGGSKELGTYYNLPNVPHNMFFYKGFAVHGAYWHNNFGQPMSHGCVNAPLSQVAQLFEWTGPVVPSDSNVAKATDSNPGTKVFVH